MLSIVLKRGKVKAVLQRHPWVFSSVLEKIEGKPANGDLVKVLEHDIIFLAYGYFNDASSVKNKPVITPLWRFGEITKSGGNTFIEIPIIVQKKQIALYNYLKEPESETINLSRLNFSFQRLLSYKTAKGKFNELILTYIPSYSYITSHGIDAPKLKINNIK